MKLFVVLLIVLALLFAVGVGLGARGGEGGGKVDPSDHGWIETWFGAPRKLDPSALTGACVSGGSLVVMPGLTCDLEAPKEEPGRWIKKPPPRSLSLALRQGAGAVLKFEPAGGPSLPGRQRLSPGDKVQLTVSAGGGSLQVTCEGTGNCVLAAP